MTGRSGGLTRTLSALAVCVLAAACDALDEPDAAAAFRLAFPVDCALGDNCFIQNYFDRDPGPGAADFGCGALSYDTHRGTDIGLPDMAALAGRVAVRAAAPGTVRATRDDMPDILPSDPNAPDLTNRNCGNAVVIDHRNGWETHYCHLRLGAVAVRPGDTVAAGAKLGEIGLSGNTEFPHLHLELRKDGRPVDPFQPDGGAICGDTTNAVWADDIRYVSGGLLTVGFAAAPPEFAEVKAGGAHAANLPHDAPALVLWAHLFGGRPGDILVFRVTGPDGELFKHSVTLDRTQARVYRSVGRRRGGMAAWAPGAWSGEVLMLRNGVEVGRMATRALVADPDARPWFQRLFSGPARE